MKEYHINERSKNLLAAKLALVEEHLKVPVPDMNRVRTLLKEMQEYLAKLLVA